MWFWILGWFFTVLALLGNGLVIFLVISRPRIRTTTNWFITSLAVADFCAALTFFPPRYISHWFYEIDLGHAGLWYKICFTFMYSSTTNLCVLTADRYIAVVNPLKYACYRRQRSSIFRIFAAWITPLTLFTLPAVLSYRGNSDFTLVFETNRVFMFQVFPCIFFLFVTCRLIYIARKISRQCATLEAQLRYNHALHQSITLRNVPNPEKRASLMIILIITLFNITYAGGNGICYCFILKTCVVPATLYQVIHLFFITNVTANPFVYAFLKKDIRKELVKLLKRKQWRIADSSSRISAKPFRSHNNEHCLPITIFSTEQCKVYQFGTWK